MSPVVQTDRQRQFDVCMKMMDAENENECTSTSTDDVEMMTNKPVPSGEDDVVTLANNDNNGDGDGEVTSMTVSPQPQMTMNNGGESDQEIAADNNSISSPSPNNIDSNSNAPYDHAIHSPEPEDLTIDEGGDQSVEDGVISTNNVVSSSSPAQSPPASPINDKQSPESPAGIQSPTGTTISSQIEIQSPDPNANSADADEEDGDLQIDETTTTTSMHRSDCRLLSLDVEEPMVQDEVDNTETNEDIDMYGDIDSIPIKETVVTPTVPKSPTIKEEELESPSSPPMEIKDQSGPSSPPMEIEDHQGPSSPVDEHQNDAPSSPPMPEPVDESPSSPPIEEQDQDGTQPSTSIASPSPKHVNEDRISSDFPKNEDSMLSQENDDIHSENDDEGPQSPEASNQSNGMLGTPISLVEESQSQSSPPAPVLPKPKKKTEKPPVSKKLDDGEEPEEGEDLEDGEIMDEEEEEEEVVEVKEVPKPIKKVSSSSGKSSSKDKYRDKSEKSSEKKNREKDKEELDPVKRLLAEVKEKDAREKEEREKRRKDKKRPHKDDKDKVKDNKEPIGKKKKRKVSEEDDEGEEFLFVRGASPGAGNVENWDEVDDRRGKRRRESDDMSPGHRNRRGGVNDGSISPTRNRINERPKSSRQERREPKSDVICAYFMQGKCQKSADQCNFSHDAIPPRKMELCKFWMMECCAKKEKCLYLHNDFPCKYFHTGLVCRLGDKCKFSHNPLSDVTKQVLLKHIETAPKEILGDFPRLNRTGALNLINKMEAKLKGIPYVEEENNENDMMTHSGPPHHGHGGPERHGGPPERHGGGPDRHGHQDRHHHDRSRESNRGHFGGPGHNDNSRGRGGGGHDRGGDRGGGPDRGDNRDRRQSRWEQSQPTRVDQEKLQELMSEAGISGFYKDTMGESPRPNHSGGSTQMPSNQNSSQSQMFTPQIQNMQPPLMPMLPPFLPQMLSQVQGMQPVNNPALASVLAQLQIPSTSIAPPQFPPPIDTSGSSPTQTQGDENKSKNKQLDSGSSIPDNLPKMQRELFERIQQQQKKNQNKVQTQVSSEPEEPEENWYSDDEEEDSKKKEELKAEINDQISSVLNQIRQQSQQQQSSNAKEPESLKTFFGDTDLRSSTNASTDFKDVDLRTSAGLFKKINILPATEINASLTSHEPRLYKVLVVAGVKEKPDYSSVRQSLAPQAILMDPRLGPRRKRSNSIPAPESPTDQSSDGLIQPMSIPDATPVFDPRTMKGGGSQPSGGRGLLDTPNPFESNSMPGMNMHMNNMNMNNMNMNDYNNPFNRDPRGPGGNNNAPPSQPPPNPAAAAQLAQNFAAVSALMQQQWPNGQPPIDPSSLFMLGFPFLQQPQAQGQPGGQPPPGMDFSMMQNHGMRMRPPFMPGNQPQPSSQQQPPPASSWERFNRGQGNLSPPL